MKQQVVILNGPPRCGKDTLLKELPEILAGDIYDLRFSQALKLGCHALVGLSHQPMEAYDKVKDIATDDFFGMTPREFYIYMSEKVLKPLFGNDIFGRLWLRKFLHDFGQQDFFSDTERTIVVCDLGFHFELKPMLQYFGEDNITILRIHRKGKTFVGDSRHYLCDVPCNSYDIENPEGDVQAYYRNAATALRDAKLI